MADTLASVKKALNERISSLAKRVGEDEKRIDALEAPVPGPAGPPGPAGSNAALGIDPPSDSPLGQRLAKIEGEGLTTGQKLAAVAATVIALGASVAALLAGSGGEAPSTEPTTTPETAGCTAMVSSSSALRSAVNQGGTVCGQGDLGDVDLSQLRPTQPVTVRGSFGSVDLTGSANLTVEGSFETVSASGTTSQFVEDLVLRNCTGGGSEGARAAVFAIVDIGANVDGFTIDDCDLGWTTSRNGADAFGVRAVNGDAGPIRNLTIERSYLHSTANDAIQLAGVSNLTVDRIEIAYVGADYVDWHADPIQILSLGGTASANVFSNNYIHHTGYLDGSGTLAVNGSAGQWIWEPSGSGAVVRNNLIVDNRNYALNWYGQVGNVTLERNTIVRDGTAFGQADSAQWQGSGGKGRVAKENIIAGMGGGEGVAFSGNVWMRGGPRSPSDIAQPVTFDAAMQPTNLPAAFAGAGYRKPGP